MRGLRNGESVVALVLLASLVGHFAIQKHFERRSKSLSQSALAERVSVAPSWAPYDAPRHFSNEEIPIGPAAMFARNHQSNPGMLHDPLPDGVIVPAMELRGDDPAKTRRADQATDPVPAPGDAVPGVPAPTSESATESQQSSAVRSVIEQELSHATPEERDIWFDELKTVPADIVRDLLKVRKQIHALPRLLAHIPEKLASTDATLSVLPREVPAETASQRIRFNLPDYHAATGSLESAVSQLRHNLTNAATPGFKRIRVTLVDAYGSSWQTPQGSTLETAPDTRTQGEGCRIAPLVLDVKQGCLKKTSRQFDLAIEGEGFFVVRQGDKQFLTRCGAFTLDRDRQLSLIATGEAAVLLPPLVIPDDAREVQISARGIVTMLNSDESELKQIGQLRLGRVSSPARLTPVGNTLLAASDASGAVVTGNPIDGGFGELQQGCLEESNVDFERELEEIERLTTILAALPLPSARPATARSHSPSPQR